MHDARIKAESIRLRAAGLSHSQIADRLDVPRPTIVTWNRAVTLGAAARQKISERMRQSRELGRQRAMEAHRKRRLERKSRASAKVEFLRPHRFCAHCELLVLGALYLGEGSKGDRSSLTFGNSDPEIVSLYLKLLRSSLQLDESKFRCTVQLRAGQDAEKLEEFCADVTRIPRTQFYGARFDTRGGSAKMRKPEYKGVCRIDYLSADTLYEVQAVAAILTGQ